MRPYSRAWELATRPHGSLKTKSGAANCRSCCRIGRQHPCPCTWSVQCKGVTRRRSKRLPNTCWPARRQAAPSVRQDDPSPCTRDVRRFTRCRVTTSNLVSKPGSQNAEPRTIIEAIDPDRMVAVLADRTVARTHAGLEKASRAAPTCCTSVDHSQLGADAGVVPAEVEILDKGTTALLAMTPRLGHQAPQAHWPANSLACKRTPKPPVKRSAGAAAHRCAALRRHRAANQHQARR